MARQSVGFVDQHIEKIVIGLCGVIMIGTVLYSFGGFRFSVDGRSPGQLSEDATAQATRLAEAVRAARPKASQSGNSQKENEDIERLKRWFDQGPDSGLLSFAQVTRDLPRAQPFPPSISAIDRKEDRHDLARMVPPGAPLVTTGRTTFEIPPRISLDELSTGGLPKVDSVSSQRNWASVAAQVDLVAQEVNFLAEKYPRNAYLTIVSVQLQRFDTGQPNGDWETVDTYQPFTPFGRPRAGEPIEEIQLLLDEGEEYVARPRLPPRKSGDAPQLPPVPYLDEYPEMDPQKKPNLAKLAGKWYDTAKRALDGKSPWKSPDLEAALMLARAAKSVGAGADLTKKADTLLNDILKKWPKGSEKPDITVYPPPPERLMPIVAHDLDADPGRTFIYRLRYEALNHYAGIRGELNDPTDAEFLTLFSDWSPPTREVMAESDVYFFLTKADEKAGEATVTVCKKTNTGWKSKDFKVMVGDDIGRNDRLVKKADFSTNTLVVDIDFSRTTDGRKDTALVYFDLNTRNLKERLLSADKNSKLFKSLNAKNP